MEQNEIIEKLLSQYGHIISAENKENPQLEKIIQIVIDYYETVISCMPGHVYWLDKNAITVGCNKNTLDNFGFKSHAEFKGLSYDDLGRIGKWSQSAIDAFKADSLEVMRTGQPKLNVEEEAIPNAKGEYRSFLTNRVPMFSPMHHLIGMIGISVDITKLKEMQAGLQESKEKAERDNQIKSQFLAVMNHELRTPLVSILGLLDFLKQVDLPAREEKNILAAIKNCTHHLLGLVNEVSDFNKLETGKYKVRYDPVDIDGVLYEVYEVVKTLAKNKGIELRVDTAREIPKNILTDMRILTQILINLVSNAIKFTDEGYVCIRTRCKQIKEGKATLKFSIIDTGKGIPQDKLKAIFEPFQQLEDAYTRQSSRNGTGLGLTIVDKLADLVNAQVSVKSKVGKGSVFTLMGDFTVTPRECLDAKNGQQLFERKLHAKPKPKKLHNPNVLLIEDDPIVQYVHTKMLNSLGCQVQVASHGEEALDKLKNHDIVFVDISLPDMNGFDVIREIRSRLKRSMPIVALTVYTGEEEKKASFDAGADEFASKPISQARFKNILVKYLAT